MRMITNNAIHIVYFTGTGGTRYAANCLLDIFKEAGVVAYSSEIFQVKMPVLERNETLVLLFPVYAADAPLFVYKWISTLQRANDEKAVVISVSGGGEISPNTACRIKVIKKLTQKGYQVKNEYMLCMPTNFITPTNDILAVSLLKVLPQKCVIIAKETLENIGRRKIPLFRDKLILYLCQGEKFGGRLAGKTMTITNSCNGCGLCSIECPSSNIIMENRKPRYGWHCTLCLRCVYLCPQKALRLRILRKFVLKGGFSLTYYINRLNEELSLEDKSIPKGYLWKGVLAYLHDENAL
jgi:ferredoxin/flavodoxin